MYGWLTYTPQDLKARKGSSCELRVPALQSPDEKTLSNAARAQGAGQLVNFLKTLHFSALAQDTQAALKADLLVLINHVGVAQGLEFAMHMLRQHHLLPAEQRQQREQQIARVVDAHFADLAAPPEKLVWRMGQLKTIAKMFPDLLMDFTLRAICADYREYMTEGTHGLTQEPTYNELHALLQEAAKHGENYPGDASEKRDAVLRLFMTRPGGELAATMARYRLLVERKRLNVLFKALRSAKASADLHECCGLDAVARLMEALCNDTIDDSWNDAIEQELQRARSDYEGLSRRVICATIEALDGGLDIGQLRAKESREAVARWRLDSLSVSQRMTPARAAKERAKPLLEKNLSFNQPRNDLAVTQAWSLDALASWIDGPVTGESSLALNPASVVKTFPKANTLPTQVSPQQPAPTPVKGQSLTPLMTPPKPVNYTEMDVLGAMLDAYSATACFLRDELQDLLALIAWPSQVMTQVQAVQARLLKLAIDPKTHAAQASELLTQAENTVADLRTSVKDIQATEQVQRRFQSRLALALRAEALVMGKRRGGVIQCPARPSDWSFAVANFHNRCLPWVGSIEVDNVLMPLDSHQAVALYVTGSSQSGYAFDVSVHLWRRRAGRTSPPSQEAGAYPPMNTTDWFDTRVPCCVLHVPHA